MYNVLFYGDSNTWGYDPATGWRYPYKYRWTSICREILGSEFNCIPAGMNGRTTAFDDPEKGARNGLLGLDYELQTHKPLDLFVVMLGTNDMKYTDAKGSAEGMEKLVHAVLTVNERFSQSSPVFFEKDSTERAKRERIAESILLISPILLNAHLGAFPGDITESKRLTVQYKRIADRYGLHFIDAAYYAEASDIDGVHLSREGHERLGTEIAYTIKAIRNGEEYYVD